MMMTCFQRAGGLLLLLCSALSAHAADNITFSGTLIVKPPCVLSGTLPIDVTFGDNVPTNEVDGIHHDVPINYSLDCAVADALNATALKLTVSGTGATFDSGVLKTTNDNLGIQLLQGSSKTHLAPGTPLDFTNRHPPELRAVLVKNGATLAGGAFSATATLSVEYR
jgi:type 1 fimbria pilin